MAKKKPTKEVDLRRLLTAIESSRLSMTFFREEHVRNTRHLSGSRYSVESARKRTFVNLLQLYISIVGRSLIAKNPRVMLSTFDRGQKPTVTAMEKWINEEYERRNIANMLGRIVTNALFSVGIGKIALASPLEAANKSWRLKAGSPFLECIELDDFVFDVHARDFAEVDYIGHRYRAPLEVAQEFEAFDKESRQALVESRHAPYNAQGDERIGMIGRGYWGIHDEAEPKVDLWEIYVPRHRLIYTFADDALTGAVATRTGGSPGGHDPVPLRVQNWLGPEEGPYHMLGFQYIPGNPFPKGPIEDLADLHEAANGTYRKLMRQVDRMKAITLTRNQDDYNRIKTTNDGGGTFVDDPKATQEVIFRGCIQELATIFQEIWQRFSLMAGNLMTMGGLGTQANTLGQEELLANQSNGQVASMQDATYNYVSEVSRALLWYWWNDPTQIQKTTFSPPGSPEISVKQRIYPWHANVPGAMKRQGPMPQIRIDPYSMGHKTPQQRAQALTQFVTQVFVPLAQVAAQQGVAFDFNAYAGLMAQFLDEPDLQTILTIQTPPQQESSTGGGAADQMAGPSQTSREYVRRDAGNGPAEPPMAEQLRQAFAQRNGQAQPS